MIASKCHYALHEIVHGVASFVLPIVFSVPIFAAQSPTPLPVCSRGNCGFVDHKGES